MLGSRFLGDPLAGGMPRWKYVSNRFLTGVENLAFGLHLSEYHTGLRAYSRRLLETIPYAAQQRRLRLRPGADRPGRGGRDGGADRRGRRSRPATSRRRRSVGLQAERRVRPVDPARRRPLPAPPAARAAARRSSRAPPPSTDRPMTISRNALLRATLGIAISVVAIWHPDPLGRPRGRRSQVLRTASPAWIAVMFVTAIIDIGAAGRPLAGPARADRAAAVPAGPRLHLHRLPRQQRPAGTARASCTGATPSARGEGISRTTVLGTVVVERVVDTVMVVAIAAVAVLVLSVRGVMTQRGPARAGVRRRCSSSGSGSGSRPIGCPAPIASPRSSPAGRASSSWPAGCATAWPSPARPRVLVAALAFSAVAWTASTGTFLAAGQAVGVELSVAQAALLTSGVALVTIVPSGPGYVGHVRADGRRPSPTGSASRATRRSRSACSSTS